jgi:hypothetical protein
MFTVTHIKNKNMYVVYDIRAIDGSTYFLLFKEKDNNKQPGFKEWVWENSNMYIPASLK